MNNNVGEALGAVGALVLIGSLMFVAFLVLAFLALPALVCDGVRNLFGNASNA